MLPDPIVQYYTGKSATGGHVQGRNVQTLVIDGYSIRLPVYVFKCAQIDLYTKFSLCDDVISYCVELHEYLQRRDGEDTDITEVRIRTLISDPTRDCLGYAVRRLETKEARQNVVRIQL